MTRQVATHLPRLVDMLEDTVVNRLVVRNADVYTTVLLSVVIERYLVQPLAGAAQLEYRTLQCLRQFANPWPQDTRAERRSLVPMGDPERIIDTCCIVIESEAPHRRRQRLRRS